MPERAAPTTSMSDSNCKSLRTFSRVSATSSTISTRTFSPEAIINPSIPSNLPLRRLWSRIGRRALVREYRSGQGIDPWLQGIGQFCRYGYIVLAQEELERGSFGRQPRLVARVPQGHHHLRIGIDHVLEGDRILRRDDQRDDIRGRDRALLRLLLLLLGGLRICRGDREITALHDDDILKYSLADGTRPLRLLGDQEERLLQ